MVMKLKDRIKAELEKEGIPIAYAQTYWKSERLEEVAKRISKGDPLNTEVMYDGVNGDGHLEIRTWNSRESSDTIYVPLNVDGFCYGIGRRKGKKDTTHGFLIVEVNPLRYHGDLYEPTYKEKIKKVMGMLKIPRDEKDLAFL